MKKTAALLFAALLAVVPLSAQATAERPVISISSFDEWVKAGVDNGWIVDNKIAEQPKPDAEATVNEESEPATEEVVRPKEKTLVIIDSYFDSSKISGNVLDVCVAKDSCVNTPKPDTRFSSPYNHGTAMAEIARKHNPGATLILLRAAPVNANGSFMKISGVDFLNGLSWVEKNSKTVSAVSFSYNLSGNMKFGECKLSTYGGTNVKLVDADIRSTISSLESSGIPVFAATGNDSNRKPVIYPACIPNTMSVAAGVGEVPLRSSNHDANTDFVGLLPANVFNYTSQLFGLLPQTTSSATAAVAALWIKGVPADRMVRVSR